MRGVRAALVVAQLLVASAQQCGVDVYIAGIQSVEPGVQAAADCPTGDDLLANGASCQLECKPGYFSDASVSNYGGTIQCNADGTQLSSQNLGCTREYASHRVADEQPLVAPLSLPHGSLRRAPFAVCLPGTYGIPDPGVESSCTQCPDNSDTEEEGTYTEAQIAALRDEVSDCHCIGGYGQDNVQGIVAAQMNSDADVCLPCVVGQFRAYVTFVDQMVRSIRRELTAASRSLQHHILTFVGDDL
eukprot:SAG31_NODE_2958_length_4852_cov_1.980644_8_plen_245_part_00